MTWSSQAPGGMVTALKLIGGGFVGLVLGGVLGGAPFGPVGGVVGGIIGGGVATAFMLLVITSEGKDPD